MKLIEMGWGAMMYIPNFMKIGSGIRKLIRGGETHRHTGFVGLFLLLPLGA
jgi:hypothetical protein